MKFTASLTHFHHLGHNGHFQKTADTGQRDLSERNAFALDKKTGVQASNGGRLEGDVDGARLLWHQSAAFHRQLEVAVEGGGGPAHVDFSFVCHRDGFGVGEAESARAIIQRLVVNEKFGEGGAASDGAIE